MKKYWEKMLLLLGLAVLIAITLIATRDFLTFEAMKKNSSALTSYVKEHYYISLLIFGAAFLSTSFMIPGALALTVVGGFLFGAWAGTLYASFFSTVGAVLAFLASRYLIGDWIQERYRNQLRYFNKEIERHGHNYLFIMRVVPVMPAFLLNYLSGLTRISTLRFTIVTFLGIFPGAGVYSLAGRELANIQEVNEIFSAKVIVGLSLLALLAIVPVVYARLQRKQ